MVQGMMELRFRRSGKAVYTEVPVHIGAAPFPGQLVLEQRMAPLRAFTGGNGKTISRIYPPNFFLTHILGFCGGNPNELDAPTLDVFSSRTFLGSLFARLARFGKRSTLDPHQCVIRLEHDGPNIYSLSDTTRIVASPKTPPIRLSTYQAFKPDPTDLVHFGDPNHAFSLEVVTAKPRNQALLIGHKTNLAGVGVDVTGLQEALSKRGLNTTTIYPSPCAVAILNQLDLLANIADSNGVTVISFSGHGHPNGLGIQGYNSKLDVLRPEEIFNLLSVIPGKKLLVIDACQTLLAGFLENVPRETFVITATDPYYQVYEDRARSIPPNYLHAWDCSTAPTKVEYGGVLTSAFRYVLAQPGNSGLLTVAEIVRQMRFYAPLSDLGVQLYYAGDESVALPPKESLF